MTHLNPPQSVADELRRLTAQELSLPSRLRYVMLLLVAAAMTAISIALLATEPALPLRTSVSFAVLALIGASWTIFAAWVLTRKHALLGNHRVVAGRLAVLFCAVFVIGALAVGVATSRLAPFAAAGEGAVMLAVAIAQWARARRRFEALSRRREELQRELTRA